MSKKSNSFKKFVNEEKQEYTLDKVLADWESQEDALADKKESDFNTTLGRLAYINLKRERLRNKE